MSMKKPSSGRTVSELRRHILELGTAFDVLIHEDETMKLNEATAGVVLATGQKIVCIPCVRCEATYAVALHELGHAIAPNGMLGGKQQNNIRLMLVEEEAAWEWAYHQALIWSDAMQKVRDFGMSSYMQTLSRIEQAERESRARAERVSKWLREIL